MPPLHPPISMSGMLIDKGLISYWGCWESSSTQLCRQPVDQSWHESWNSFVIPMLTLCKSSVPPKLISLRAYYLGFPATTDKVLRFSSTRSAVPCLSSPELTGSCGCFQSTDSPASSTGISYSLPQIFLWHYRCFLSLKQGQPTKVGKLTLGKQYSVRSNPFPQWERRVRTWRPWPRHSTGGKFWCVLPEASQKIHMGSPRCSQWLSAP